MPRSLVSMIVLLSALAASAQEFRVHQYWLANEEYGRVTPSGGGDWVFSWDTDGEFPCSSTSVMRAMTAAGIFTTDDIEVFSCAAAGPADLAFQPTGAFVAAGTGLDSSSGGVFARSFTAIGSPLGAEFLVNESEFGLQTYARVATVSPTSYVVVWQDENQPTAPRGRIVNADGSMPGSEVVLSEPASANRLDPSVTVNGGRILATWSAYPSGVRSIRARAFDALLVPLGPEMTINESGTGGGAEPVTMASGFLVAWVHSPATNEFDIYARYIDFDGSPLGNQFVVNRTLTGPQGPLAVASDSTGRAVVAYDSHLDQVPIGVQGVYAQRLDAQGNLLGPEFRANAMTYDSQGVMDVGMQPNGDFVILWGSYQDPNGSYGLYARRYSFPVSLLVASGPGTSNPPLVDVSRPDGSPGFPTIAPFATGGFGANPGAGDVDADGLDEVLAGPGPSPVYGPHVRAFERDGTAIQKISFYAYGTLKYGVIPAAGRIDGDASSEILTTPGPGEVFGPHVRGFDYDGVRIAPIPKVSYFAYGTLKYGARSAAGDVDGDGYEEILTGPGPGPTFASQVRGWDYDGTQLRGIGSLNFNAFASGARGATVGASDVESDGVGGWGDGFAEIVAGQGPDPGASQAALFDYDGASVLWLHAIAPYATPYGVLVAGGDADGGDTGEIATAPGPDPTAPARVLVWDWDVVVGTNPDGPALHVIGPDDFTAFAGRSYGASIAVGDFD